MHDIIEQEEEGGKGGLLVDLELFIIEYFVCKIL